MQRYSIYGKNDLTFINISQANEWRGVFKLITYSLI
jgi:hypothetical protein